MDTTTIPNFSSEEEREKYIGGDRDRRIMLELAETEAALNKIQDLSQLINEKTKKITDFYRVLEDKLRYYEIGYPFILKDEQDDIKDQKYRLCYEEDAAGNMFFWRLGFAKINSNWHIVAHHYKEEYAKCYPVEGPDPRHIWLDDRTIRLTHASRGLRTSAAHVIGDFVKKFLAQVSHSERMVDIALKRVEKLETLVA